MPEELCVAVILTELLPLPVRWGLPACMEEKHYRLQYSMLVQRFHQWDNSFIHFSPTPPLSLIESESGKDCLLQSLFFRFCTTLRDQCSASHKVLMKVSASLQNFRSTCCALRQV